MRPVAGVDTWQAQGEKYHESRIKACEAAWNQAVEFWAQCKLHIAHAAGSPAGSWALLGDQTGNHSFVLGKA